MITEQNLVDGNIYYRLKQTKAGSDMVPLLVHEKS
jgi:hypothetical protein